MKTSEEIKKALERCGYSGSCKPCAYFDEDGKCIGRLKIDALTYIQQLENQIADIGKKVPKWISVKDRLPPKNDVCVLCHCDTTGAVTHWMPLPQPPKEEHHD